MSQEIHVGDIGTLIEITVTDSGGVVDVSAATVKQILLRKPNGTVLTKTASFKTDGADGILQYTTVDGDLDKSGIWKLQVRVTLPTGTWKSDTQTFLVHANLA